MKKATLYFHYPCFDGLVSAVLACEYLEKCVGWSITKAVPVDYDLRNRWLSKKLKTPCAVVDFLYHPKATFWADHHKTSIVSPRAKASYQHRKKNSRLFFDDRAPSCAGLLYRHLRKSFTDKPHFKELVQWAEKIDSAAYSSVQEAVLGNAPALKINRALQLKKEGGPEFARFLLRELRSHDLSYVATLKEVRQREKQVRRDLSRGLKTARNKARLEDGNVVVLDTRSSRDQIINRYFPYSFNPDARYSIGIVRMPHRIAITAMRNPWRKFKSIELGRALEEFGGGGHRRVGAVRLPANQSGRVADVVKSLLTKMREPRRQGRKLDD